MAAKTTRKIPRFFGFRIYFSATVLYYWLVLPFLLILTIKYAPELQRRSQERSQSHVSDTLIRPDSLRQLFNLAVPDSIQSMAGLSEDTLPEDNAPDIMVTPNQGVVFNQNGNQSGTISDNGSQIGKAFNILFNFLLVSFFLGFVFNLPFKRYFSRKRKHKPINPKLFKFTKRFLLKSPQINAAILGVAFLGSHIFMLIKLFTDQTFDDDLERTLYIHLFYISLTASVLSLLFVYYWEKHRVHIRYIEHIFTAEELRKRIFNIKVGRIRNRMFVSSAMTTLLPLTIVIFYLFLSITYLRDLNIDEYTDEQRNILFGDYQRFRTMFGGGDAELNMPGWLFYINAINSFFMFIGIYSSIFIAFIYILFIVKWTTQDIVHPVKELLQNMRLTGQGELNNYSIVRTNDEIGELTEGYNEMTSQIGEHIQNISRMTEAYSYFVPRQFLDFLGKKSFVDIRLGDQVEKEMTVLFSDIRSFTEISEQMTPKENFDFINYYLGYMEPVIRNNNGFIDKYIGDSIMALFSESAEDAINASIEMRIKLSQFNQVMDQFDKPTINSGIGIHSGSLMLGVVGGEGRMDGTVISDAVNLAARLEGLTKVYGSSIIISQDTLIKLNNPGQYNYRFLDIVKVKGKKEAVYIFEIIDGDPEDVRQIKLKTKNLFAEGINYYKSQQFARAIESFASVFEQNPEDKAAHEYIKRCKKFIERGVPDDWDGIQTIAWDENK
jgi:class 3 adenylate cyclase